MKAGLTSSKEKGFSTLEILIAFAVIILALTSVISLIFSSQSVVTDSRADSEATAKAQGLLESTRAAALLDFSSVNPIAAAQDGIYQKSLDVQTQDFSTKKVTAIVAWHTEARSQRVELATLISNWENISKDDCVSSLSGNWQNPQINSLDLGTLIGDTVGTYTISDMEAYQNKLYVAVSNTVVKTAPDFFVFDLSNPGQPVFLSGIDTDSKVIAGITSLRVSGKYAYVASSSSYARGQLQIIDISINPPQVVTTYKIPVINSGGGSKGLGSSIFYNNGFVYLGLTKTDSENEFNIIDVSNVLNPVFKGSLHIGNGINAIYVKGNYAYLAHPTDVADPPEEQLSVLDVTNPMSPQRVSGFFYNGASGGNGKSLALVGNTLYLGRTASKISGSGPDAIPEFYALNDSNPNNIPAAALGTVPLATPESLNALTVRDYLAFFLVTDQLQIWNISNPANIIQWASPVALPGSSAAMACEGNYMYAGSTLANKNFISVISAGP